VTVQPREEMIDVGGTRVHTLIGGSGPPVLTLHGAGGPRGWRRWMAALAERYTVYVPAHPGFGTSDAADWMESVDDLARFYLWFLDAIGLDRAHVLGQSLGGWTAAELATMAPGRVDRLVLVAAVGLKPERSDNEILDVFFHTPEEVLRHTLYAPESVPEYAEVYGATPTPAAIEITTRNREMTARLTWKPYMHNPRLPHFLPRVTVPTLIVWGREDRIVPLECGEQYQRLLPNAVLRVLERCGHVPPLEHPEAFTMLVREFLGGKA